MNPFRSYHPPAGVRLADCANPRRMRRRARLWCLSDTERANRGGEASNLLSTAVAATTWVADRYGTPRIDVYRGRKGAPAGFEPAAFRSEGAQMRPGLPCR